MSERDTFISVMIIDIARQVLTPPREEGAAFGSPIETNPVIGSEGQRWVGGSSRVVCGRVLGKC